MHGYEDSRRNTDYLLYSKQNLKYKTNICSKYAKLGDILLEKVIIISGLIALLGWITVLMEDD